MWMSKDNTWESVISFHHACHGALIQVVRLGGTYLYQLSLLADPRLADSSFLKCILVLNFATVSLCVYVHMSVGACGGHKVLDSLEPELKMVVSYLTWVLGPLQEQYVFLTAELSLQLPKDFS